MKRVKLGNKWVGEGYPPYISAEVASNHQGSVDIAKKLIREAKRIGVDAVKFQKKDIETCFAQELLNSPYNNDNSFGKTYREHKQFLEFSEKQMKLLKDYTESYGLAFFCTPFDIPSVEVLERIGIPFYKIASFHVDRLDLIERICQTGKPIIMSTGMSTLDEVDKAVSLVRQYHDNLILLHCVSSYPLNESDMNLNMIPFLRERYGCPVGYSGHERNVSTCIATTMLGSCMIERHFTLDRTMKGADHALSVEPQGMEMIVKRSKGYYSALGLSEKKLLDCELETRRKNRACKDGV